MIRTVIKCPDNMVMAFDEKGEQIPKYQDLYDKVKDIILNDSPKDAAFWYMSNGDPILKRIAREEW